MSDKRTYKPGDRVVICRKNTLAVVRILAIEGKWFWFYHCTISNVTEATGKLKWILGLEVDCLRALKDAKSGGWISVKDRLQKMNDEIMTNAVLHCRDPLPGAPPTESSAGFSARLKKANESAKRKAYGISELPEDKG